MIVIMKILGIFGLLFVVVGCIIVFGFDCDVELGWFVEDEQLDVVDLLDVIKIYIIIIVIFD